MKQKIRLYNIVRQIHLYSSLLTVALILMYIITSYMMIYHDFFKVERQNESKTSVIVNPEEVNDANWSKFLRKHKIQGRLVNERYDDSGDLLRTYASKDTNSNIKLLSDKNEVEIKTTNLNLSGSIIGLHRLRGYGGSLLYNIYAFMLDVTGLSLILFSVTGVILWLKLLKFNKIAWAIFISGFIYVGAVILYLCNN